MRTQAQRDLSQIILVWAYEILAVDAMKNCQVSDKVLIEAADDLAKTIIHTYHVREREED